MPKNLEGWDWIKLTSGEWLKGEVKVLNQEKLDFESDELDDLSLDWDKVAELVSGEFFTVRLVDRTTVTGVPHIVGHKLELRTPGGGRTDYARKEIQSFIRGEPTEANYWSGRIRLGLTAREGNTDQIDNTANLNTTRRTSLSRLALSLDSVVSNVSGVENANNQTLQGSFDLYLTPRFYATPLGFEFFRDRIQNIDLRATPYAGLGYSLLDTATKEWDLSGGLGYRLTNFDSVAMGQSGSTETTTALLGSKYTQDLTQDIELEVSYGVQIGLEDTNDTNQNFQALLTFEFVWDLDFTVDLVWKRIGQPEQDSLGDTPDKNDLRIDIGLSWSF